MIDTVAAGTADLPIATPGMRIGLFGGSFNPAHEGHRLVALECLKRLALDKVWVLVSPGNPLKDHSELAPLADRIAETRALMNHPALEVTGFEAAHGLPLHLRNRSLSDSRPASGTICLDHGRRQPRDFRPLGALGRHRRRHADGRLCAARHDVHRDQFAGRGCPAAGAPARGSC